MRKILILFSLFIFISHNSFAAKKTKDYFRIPKKDFQILETQDHDTCIARGVNNITDIYEIFYWRCRIQVIDERIDEIDARKNLNKFYRGELLKVRQVMEYRLEKANSDLLAITGEYTKEYNNIKLGNLDRYYYDLLSHRVNVDLYDVNPTNAVQAVESEVKHFQKNRVKFTKDIKYLLKNYPECIQYRANLEEFKECISLKDDIDKCRAQTEENIEKKIRENKFNCKVKATEEYPDHMALYNSEYEELQKIKFDEYVVNNEKDKKILDRKLELNKLISGPRLSKQQLINLRAMAEQKCLMDSELELNIFRSIMEQECKKIMGQTVR